MALDKAYVTGLLASVEANAGVVPMQQLYETSEWEARLVRCSRRLLSAIVFREMAQVTLEKTQSALLPIVGFYYTMFHAGVAMLSVDYATPLTELAYSATTRKSNQPGVTHKKVRSLLKANLTDRGVLSDSFLERLDKMKKLREHVNYAVGGRLAGDHDIETLDEGALYAQVGECLDLAAAFVKEVAQLAVVDGSTGLERIRLTIGDHFGDDLVQLYVPREHRGRVWSRLKENGLTT